VTGRAKGLLSAIFESSEDAIVTLLPDGTISSWNSSAQELFGYSEGEVIGRNIDIIIPPELEEQEHKVIMRVFAGERIKHDETVLFCKDKQRIDINLTMSPVRDTAGDITGVSMGMQDITGRSCSIYRKQILSIRHRAW
jgi:PAS domain S-box-containing protein